MRRIHLAPLIALCGATSACAPPPASRAPATPRPIRFSDPASIPRNPRPLYVVDDSALSEKEFRALRLNRQEILAVSSPQTGVPVQALYGARAFGGVIFIRTRAGCIAASGPARAAECTRRRKR
jgi:hypothetical protein